MEPEPATELLLIARALSEHLEWHRETGATGLPRDETPPVNLPSSPSGPAGSAPSAEEGPVARGPVPRAKQAGTMPIPAQKLALAPSPAVQSELLPGREADPDASAESRRVRLEQLRDEVRGCTRCGLSTGRTNTVFSRGSGASGLCFVGEGPGAEEDAQGYPFVGAAGQLLDRMIGAMGLLRDEVYVCNIVKCRPPENRKPDPSEMAACMPYLTEQIELLKPQVIVALGATAVQGLLGTSEGIIRLRGKWRLYRGRIAVMPTFHPAYLLRTPGAKRDVWDDLQTVLRQMGRPIPGRER